MKRLAKELRVRPGEAVDLNRRPTLVKPVYESKQEYKQLLDEHVARLSALQELLYASNIRLAHHSGDAGKAQHDLP